MDWLPPFYIFVLVIYYASLTLSDILVVGKLDIEFDNHGSDHIGRAR